MGRQCKPRFKSCENHCKKQAEGRNGWEQITEQVNEDLQCVVECLDLIPVKGKTGGDKMLSEWVTLANINCPGGKKGVTVSFYRKRQSNIATCY